VVEERQEEEDYRRRSVRACAHALSFSHILSLPPPPPPPHPPPPTLPLPPPPPPPQPPPHNKTNPPPAPVFYLKK